MSVPGTLPKFGDQPAARDQLGLGPLATVQNLVGLSVTNQTLSVTTRPYGSFYDTTTQQISVANETKAITLNTISEASGVTLVNNSKVTVAASGTYNVQISVQFANTGANTKDGFIWFKKNGQVIADSNSVMAIVGSHAGVDGHMIMAMNLIMTLAAGDNIELWWSADDPGVRLQYYTGTSPVPNAPSIILTICQV